MSNLHVNWPGLNRSKSARSVVSQLDEAARTPARSPSPTFRHRLMHDAYASGVYADPKPNKMLGIGPTLATPAHKKLAERLREECQRLAAVGRGVSERLIRTEDKLSRSEQRSAQMEAALKQAQADLERAQADTERVQATAQELRQRLSEQGKQMARLSDDLRDARDDLADYDELFSATRSKRRSRLGARMSEDIGQARASALIELGAPAS